MNRREWIRLQSLLAAGVFLPDVLKAMNPVEMRSSDFGKDFIWGTATASYQIEGAWKADGKGESIWDRFTHSKPGKIKTRENGDVAVDFYNRYESDLDLMQQMGLQHFRFSISWPRLLPEGSGKINQKGIDFYNRLIDACLKRNITPWVTLYHWDMPQLLEDKGGWVNRDVIGWFDEYSMLCAKSFGDRVKNWMIFNEPTSFLVGGYLVGMHAPGKVSPTAFFKGSHHVNLCQGSSGRILKAEVKNGFIGTTLNCMTVDPATDRSFDRGAAARMDAIANRLYMEPLLGMGYPEDTLPALWRMENYMKPEDEKNIVHNFDFIGLQNYSRMVAKHLGVVPFVRAINVPAKELGHEITEMDWEVYPEGIYQVLKRYHQDYRLKNIIITENGAAFPDQWTPDGIHDEQRTKYIQDYLSQVLKAKQEGVPVNGYFVWSFLDNFEWAEGFRPRFGIVGVDIKTQERRIKDSGKWFSEFIRKP